MALMTDQDPAFLWETEALRDSPQRAMSADDRPVATSELTKGWRSIREAHETTGIPVSTLRKWARLGAVMWTLTPGT